MRASPAKYNLARHERYCSYWLICPVAVCGTFYTAGETPRAPRALSLVVICDFVLLQCSLERRPCGRLQASTTWRAHERLCSYGLEARVRSCCVGVLAADDAQERLIEMAWGVTELEDSADLSRALMKSGL